MTNEEESPAPADDAAAEDHPTAEEAPGPSGSRWEPRSDTAEPDGAAGAEHATADAAAPAGTTWCHHEAPAPAHPRRRGWRVAAAVGAAVVLAGGGFAVGHAVGDSGPGGGPGSAVGHHRDHDGGPGAPGRPAPGQGRTQGQAGQNTSTGTSAILGGLST